MSNYIQVSASSRTRTSQTQQTLYDLIGQGNQTYNLATVYEQNRHLPERKPPEGNISVIKRAIVVFYERYGIELNEDTANVTYQVDATAFGFDTSFDMHSDTGSKAQQCAKHEFTEAFRRPVTVGGNKNRVVVWVNH